MFFSIRERKNQISSSKESIATFVGLINTTHILERDGILRQHNIPILKLTKGIVSRALTALFMEQHCRRRILSLLRRHNENHRAKDDGQHHWHQYVSIVYHHRTKSHPKRHRDLIVAAHGFPVQEARFPLGKRAEGPDGFVVEDGMQGHYNRKPIHAAVFFHDKFHQNGAC